MRFFTWQTGKVKSVSCAVKKLTAVLINNNLPKVNAQFCSVCLQKFLQVHNQMLLLCIDTYLIQEPKQLCLPAFYEKAVFYVFTNPILIMGLSSNAVLKAKSNTT